MDLELFGQNRHDWAIGSSAMASFLRQGVVACRNDKLDGVGFTALPPYPVLYTVPLRLLQALLASWLFDVDDHVLHYSMYICGWVKVLKTKYRHVERRDKVELVKSPVGTDASLGT